MFLGFFFYVLTMRKQELVFSPVVVIYISNGLYFFNGYIFVNGLYIILFSRSGGMQM